VYDFYNVIIIIIYTEQTNKLVIEIIDTQCIKKNSHPLTLFLTFND